MDPSSLPQWLFWLPTEVPAATVWVAALFGLCIGSFLNVVIYRLPLRLEREWRIEAAEILGVPQEPPPELTLSKPRSRCPSCGHAIAWYENLPVVSYVALRGKCAACKAHISLRYPFVELLTGALFAAVAWRFGEQPVAWLWFGFVALLVAMSGIDWDTTLLPDELTGPLLWFGLAASALHLTIPLPQSVGGAIAGYLTLWTVYWAYRLLTGKEGMGRGDFVLLAALGAWLGWKMLLPVLLGASIVGAIVGIGMKLSATLREDKYVPFGPFLAASGIVVLLAGPERVSGWLGWR